MNITIPPELQSRLRARAEAEGLTIEGYIERIARDDQQAEEELEALAFEGINSEDLHERMSHAKRYSPGAIRLPPKLVENLKMLAESERA